MDFETHISLADYKTQISPRIVDEVLFSYYFRAAEIGTRTLNMNTKM